MVLPPSRTVMDLVEWAKCSPVWSSLTSKMDGEEVGVNQRVHSSRSPTVTTCASRANKIKVSADRGETDPESVWNFYKRPAPIKCLYYAAHITLGSSTEKRADELLMGFTVSTSKADGYRGSHVVQTIPVLLHPLCTHVLQAALRLARLMTHVNRNSLEKQVYVEALVNVGQPVTGRQQRNLVQN